MANLSAHKIVRWCQQRGMALSQFGRLAANDPRLVADLRAGRELRPTTVARVLAFMANSDASMEAQPC